jgi:drug/metabolite transporter (DMT)-like permease
MEGARTLILMPPPTRAHARRWAPLHYLRLGELMRPLTIAGIILIVFGVFVLVRGASFTSRRDVLKVGDVKVTADQQQTVPPWAGWLAIVGGSALAVAGTRRRA